MTKQRGQDDNEVAEKDRKLNPELNRLGKGHLLKERDVVVVIYTHVLGLCSSCNTIVLCLVSLCRPCGSCGKQANSLSRKQLGEFLE